MSLRFLTKILLPCFLVCVGWATTSAKHGEIVDRGVWLCKEDKNITILPSQEWVFTGDMHVIGTAACARSAPSPGATSSTPSGQEPTPLTDAVEPRGKNRLCVMLGVGPKVGYFCSGFIPYKARFGVDPHGLYEHLIAGSSIDISHAAALKENVLKTKEGEKPEKAVANQIRSMGLLLERTMEYVKDLINIFGIEDAKRNIVRINQLNTQFQQTPSKGGPHTQKMFLNTVIESLEQFLIGINHSEMIALHRRVKMATAPMLPIRMVSFNDMCHNCEKICTSIINKKMIQDASYLEIKDQEGEVIASDIKILVGSYNPYEDARSMNGHVKQLMKVILMSPNPRHFRSKLSVSFVKAPEVPLISAVDSPSSPSHSPAAAASGGGEGGGGSPATDDDLQARLDALRRI